MSGRLYLFIVIAPLAAADAVRAALTNAGAGKLGHYEACSFSVRGTGRFRPLPGADPAIGTVGESEEVEEERIETIVAEDKLNEVLAAVKKAHPYEEPAIYIMKLEMGRWQ